MLSDRLYMRDDDARRLFPALTWLICAIVGGFVVENIFLRWFSEGAGAAFFRVITLSADGITSGFVWSLITYAFVHSADGLLHVCMVALALFFFGRSVAAELGPKRFLVLFIAAVATGGLAWLLINGSRGGLLFGASAGVAGVIVVFAHVSPLRPITFFFIDVGLRAKHLALGLLLVNLLGLAFLEIPGRDSSFSMAHSAQLGGMLVGWCVSRRFLAQPRRWLGQDEEPSIELPAWMRKTKQNTSPAPVFKVDIAPVEDMRAEIDRILDKINSDGFQSLTAEEKNRLDHARDHLSRR